MGEMYTHCQKIPIYIDNYLHASIHLAILFACVTAFHTCVLMGLWKTKMK